jgi:hypothetical protein
MRKLAPERNTNADLGTRDLMIESSPSLSATAAQERDQSLKAGMYGICASSTEEGVATLKSWVTA